jgi:undecaprenyl-diphosphatase
VLLVRLGRPALFVLVAAAALAVSRVLLGVHYPADVLAGALLGTAAAVLVCFVAARVQWPFARRRLVQALRA